jgi:hypothetical protein
MTYLRNSFWTLASIVGLALGFGFLFGLIGAVGGFVVGLAISMYYEQVLGIGNPQGPLLFLLTAPVGFVIGVVFGAWKGFSLTRSFRTTGK